MKPEVWEAIERLRRMDQRPIEVFYEDWGLAIYGADHPHIKDAGSDTFALSEAILSLHLGDRKGAADYLLSVAPTGPKPEPIDPKGSSGFAVWGNNIREASWDADFDGGSLMVHVGTSRYGTSTTPLYRTESDARLALQWQRFEELETSCNR